MHKTATTTNISFCELEPRIRLDYAHVESDKRICNHFDAVNYSLLFRLNNNVRVIH